jgi:hypothetical protein
MRVCIGLGSEASSFEWRGPRADRAVTRRQRRHVKGTKKRTGDIGGQHNTGEVGTFETVVDRCRNCFYVPRGYPSWDTVLAGVRQFTRHPMPRECTASRSVWAPCPTVLKPT